MEGEVTLVKLSASQIPLEVDVWNAIEKEIKTGIEAVHRVEFTYSVDVNIVVIGISYRQKEHCAHEFITIDNPASEKLVIALCERFNIPTVNLSRLEFTLRPNEIPIFRVDLYPFVNDATTLVENKRRLNNQTVSK